MELFPVGSGLRVCSGRSIARIVTVILLIVLSFVSGFQLGLVRGDPSPYGGSTTIEPYQNSILIPPPSTPNSPSGMVKIDVPVRGIAVRIEVPREFLSGVRENDTSWITSNIRNDYYYYNVVDESLHWTYDWHDNASDGPCFKPDFSYYDPNAPYCVEIWNYLNSPLLKLPQYNVSLHAGQTFDYTDRVGVDYCQTPNIGEYVFGCFGKPKFVMFRNLVSPLLAGEYNFTLAVANRTNILGYPDFVHAWNKTYFVRVSMAYDAGFIQGMICDGGGTTSCLGPIRGKGIVYAENAVTGALVARAYVNQSSCQLSGSGCGFFKMVGLAPSIPYILEGSAGLDNGYAYSLTQYPSPIAQLSANEARTGINYVLALRRAPMLCDLIQYDNATQTGVPSLSGQSNLLSAGFRTNPAFRLNITVEVPDPMNPAQPFRFRGISSDQAGTTDSFSIITGVGVKYVGTNPYGTEFAGLPAFNEVSPGVLNSTSSGYQLTPEVYVSGYQQHTLPPATVSGPTDSGAPPSCSNQVGVSGGNSIVDMRQSPVIAGTLWFCPTQTQTCNESPHTAEEEAVPDIPIGSVNADALFGGNVVIEACLIATSQICPLNDLGGVTVINGTLPNGKTGYKSCNFKDTCSNVPFYVTGFSEYYNHTLSGFWQERDYGLVDGTTYYLQVYVRGYQLTSLSAQYGITVSRTFNNGNNTCAPSPEPACPENMNPGFVFQVTVGSYDNRFGVVVNGTFVIQAKLPWRFLNSSIPVTARVYFYQPDGFPVGYVEALMKNGPSIVNEIGVTSFTNFTFTVVFAGQNWSLRDIWFYNLNRPFFPSHITNSTTYTIQAYTLGYVPQFPAGATISTGSLNPIATSPQQTLITLFVANEIDITAPLNNGQVLTSTTENVTHVIGQVFSSNALLGAETANLTRGISTLQFNIFGFGGMELSNSTLCNTKVLLVGRLNICGQGHFYYIPPGGGCTEAQDYNTCIFDYGLNAGTYTVAIPEFGFMVHFMNVILPLPVVQFNDLLLQQGVFLEAMQMAELIQQTSLVNGWCNPNTGDASYEGGSICLVPLVGVGLDLTALSWAQVTAFNSTFSRSTSTFDGLYDGVGGLFLPAGTYTVTFSDIQYQSQSTTTPITLGWGGSATAFSPFNLIPCPTGTSSC